MMKRPTRSPGRILDQFFGRTPKPSPEQMDLSKERILQRLMWQDTDSHDVLRTLPTSMPDLDEVPPLRKPLRPVLIGLAVAEIVAVVGLMALVRNVALRVNSHATVQ